MTTEPVKIVEAWVGSSSSISSPSSASRQFCAILPAPCSSFPIILLCICVGAFSPAAKPLLAETAAEWAEARQQMVDQFVVAAGVTDARVLSVMRTVPRHEFVTPDQRPLAYLDLCLPIGGSQTISPPFSITFFDAERAPIGKAEIGPWSGDSVWQAQSARIKVPRASRLAVVTLTMQGATGEMAIDDVRIRPVVKAAASRQLGVRE
jgi:hypothetical protein